jgi:hypothetical protein
MSHRLALALGSVVLAASCKGLGLGGTNQAQSNAAARASPGIAYIKNTSSGDISSYSADATVYRENNRDPAGTEQIGKYRIRAKSIAGRLYTRLDFPAAADGTSQRTVLCDGRQTVLFETGSGKVLSRITASEPAATTLPERIMGRLDITGIQTSLKRLSFDIAKDQSGRYLVCRAPAALEPSVPDSRGSVSRRLSLLFDLAQDTLAGCVDECSLDDGEKVTTTTSDLYQEVDGQPVLTGQVAVERHEVPGALPLGDDVLPRVFDPSALPLASSADIDEAVNKGVVARVAPPIGDRTDPDYTITTVTRYDGISLNDVQDCDMRVALEGGRP